MQKQENLKMLKKSNSALPKIIGAGILCLILCLTGWYLFRKSFDYSNNETPNTSPSSLTATHNGEVLETECSSSLLIHRVGIWCSLSSDGQVLDPSSLNQDSTPRGFLEVQAIDFQGSTVAENSVRYSDLNGSSYMIILSGFSYSSAKNGNLRLRITVHQTGKSPIYLKTSGNGQPDIQLVGYLDSVDNRTLQKGFALVFAFVFTAALATYLLLAFSHMKLHLIFLIAAFLLSMGYELVLPIQSAPDEWEHFTQAYRVSDQMMNSPANSAEISMRQEDFDLLSSVSHTPDRSVYSYVFSKIGKGATQTDLKEVNVPRISWDGPTYLLGGTAITLGRLLHLNSVTVFYMARFANSLLFLLLCTLAIAVTPVKKGFFIVASLLPMVLHLGNSLSYDVEMFPMAYLVIALWLRMSCKKEGHFIFLKEWLLFCIPLILLAPCKVYILVCALAFLVPKEKFANPHWAYALQIGAFVLAVLFLLFKNFGSVLPSASGTINAHFSLGYLLLHPTKTFQLLFNTIIDYKSAFVHWLIGSSLGWLNVSVDLFWIFIFFALLLFSSLWTEEELKKLPEKFSRYQWGFLIIILLVIAGVFYAAFTWTPIVSDRIEGIQGRYFLPILPLIMLLCCQKTFITRKDDCRRFLMIAVFCNSFLLMEVFSDRLLA
jgi:uncharacterized membrane protein